MFINPKKLVKARETSLKTFELAKVSQVSKQVEHAVPSGSLEQVDPQEQL